jgi:hypothetical protein
MSRPNHPKVPMVQRRDLPLIQPLRDGDHSGINKAQRRIGVLLTQIASPLIVFGYQILDLVRSSQDICQEPRENHWDCTTTARQLVNLNEYGRGDDDGSGALPISWLQIGCRTSVASNNAYADPVPTTSAKYAVRTSNRQLCPPCPCNLMRRSQWLWALAVPWPVFPRLLPEYRRPKTSGAQLPCTGHARVGAQAGRLLSFLMTIGITPRTP